MTAEKLIEHLKSMPQDKEVYIYDEQNDIYDVNIVFIDRDGDIGLMN